MTIKDHIRPNRTILGSMQDHTDNTGPHGTIQDHIWDHTGLYGTIQDHEVLYRTITVPYRTIQSLNPLKILQDSFKNSITLPVVSQVYQMGQKYSIKLFHVLKGFE